MPLTCGIQALYDNNREVWSTVGLHHSAGQQLQNRPGFWDDVTALQNRHNQFAAVTGGRRGRTEQSVMHVNTQATEGHLAVMD